MEKDCEHKWVFKSSHYSYRSNGWNAAWKRLDIYFCEKCLEEKEILKSEDSRETPLWWQHNKEGR